MRRNTRRFSARWKNGLVSLNVPLGTGMTDINRLLDEWTPGLLARRPVMTYHAGDTLAVEGVEFRITRQAVSPDKITGTARIPVSTVGIGSSLDPDDPATARRVSDMLCKIARKIAPEVLLPYARSLADSVRRHPVGWKISTGHRILGQCSEHGIISLSYVLVFLPEELRRYIIMHEIAHLSEMNHSPRFHALLDSYLNGREAELWHRLRTFIWPVFHK